MDKELYHLIIYNILLMSIAIIGGIGPLFKRWNEDMLQLFMSFSAGVLLGATFFHLLPEAIEITGKNSPVYLLFGFVFMYIFEKFLMIHACEAFDCEIHTVGISSFFGLSIHTIFDGVALGSSSIIESIRLPVFFAIAIHKAPSALALTTLLLREKYSIPVIIIMNLFFAMMIPLGSFISFFSLISFQKYILGAVIAFSGGTFLHIAASDLLPEVHKLNPGRFRALFLFISGLTAMAIGRFVDL